MILQWTEQSYVGRVNGVLSPMFMGMMVIMMSVSGVLKTFFPLVGIYAVSGTIMLLGAMILVRIFKRKPAVQPQPQPHLEGQPTS